MSTYKKDINMGGHWMHYHLNGVNKGGKRGKGNMDAKFQTIWIKGSYVIKDFLQWVTLISSQVAKIIDLVTLNPPMLIRPLTSWHKIFISGKARHCIIVFFLQIKD